METNFMEVVENIEIKVMDLPIVHLETQMRIGKIPKDAKITYNGDRAHVEFKIKK